MKLLKNIYLFILVFLFFFTVNILPVYGENYSGWDQSINNYSSHNSDNEKELDIILLENEYKTHLYSFIQKDTELEYKIAIIDIKLTELNIPDYSLTLSEDPSTIGMRIASTAAILSGKQYWPNACAYAVNEVLKILGIDITNKVNYNPNWVPNYANLGKKIIFMSDLQPGDLIIYNNATGDEGYDHIGIYSGNGMAYNVSTSSNYRFVLTSIGSSFMEGRRLELPDVAKSEIVFPFLVNEKKESLKIKSLTAEQNLLLAETSINKQNAYREYLENSIIFYNIKIHNKTKSIYLLAEKYFKYNNLYIKGCIARKEVEETKEKLLKNSMYRYSLYKEKVLFKIENIPATLKIIKEENNKTDLNLNKTKFNKILNFKQRKTLKFLKKCNSSIKNFIKNLIPFEISPQEEENISKFPPFSLGSKKSELTRLEMDMKEAEKMLAETKESYEKARELYSLGYIAQKDLDILLENYQNALKNHELIQEKLLNYETY